MNKKWKVSILCISFLVFSIVWIKNVYEVNSLYHEKFTHTFYEEGVEADINGLKIKCTGLELYDDATLYETHPDMFSMDRYSLHILYDYEYVEEKYLIVKFNVKNETDEYIDLNEQEIFFWGAKERAWFNGASAVYGDIYKAGGIAPGEECEAWFRVLVHAEHYNEEDWNVLQYKTFSFCIVDEAISEGKRDTYELTIGTPTYYQATTEQKKRLDMAANVFLYGSMEAPVEDDIEEEWIVPEDTPYGKELYMSKNDELIYSGIGYRVIDGFVANGPEQFPEYATNTEYWLLGSVQTPEATLPDGTKYYYNCDDMQYIFLKVEITNYNKLEKYFTPIWYVVDLEKDIEGDLSARCFEDVVYFDKYDVEWHNGNEYEDKEYIRLSYLSYIRLNPGESITATVCMVNSISEITPERVNSAMNLGLMFTVGFYSDYDMYLDSIKTIKLDDLEWRLEE